MLLLSAVPTSFIFAAEETDNDQTEDDVETQPANNAIAIRTRIMLEITNRTATRIEQLIEKILANETLLEALENASLLDDFNGNVTRFEEAKSLLREAYEAMESGEYEDAIDKIAEAMSILREVLKAIHRILEDYVGELKPHVIARGLLVAMQRALERIAWIRRLAPEDETINSILDEAEEYLNITAAKEMLLEGNVTGVAHNLAKANRLIGQAFRLLKEKARMRMRARANKYLENMKKSYKKVLVKIAFAKKMGVNVSEILDELGFENETQLQDALMSMIRRARERIDDIRDAMIELQKISKAFWRMDKALTRHMLRNLWEDHKPWNNHGQDQAEDHNATQSNHGNGRNYGRGHGGNNRKGKP
jgi:tetratricopeptide (TPR) repeat protein